MKNPGDMREVQKNKEHSLKKSSNGNKHKVKRDNSNINRAITPAKIITEHIHVPIQSQIINIEYILQTIIKKAFSEDC